MVCFDGKMSGRFSNLFAHSGYRFPFLMIVTAVSDLVVRLPTDILAPAFSLAGGIVGNPSIAQLTTWGMFAAALFTFGHLAYSFHQSIPAERSGFLIIFTSWTILLGYQQTIDLGLLPRVLVWLGGSIIGGATLLWYCKTVAGWNLSSTDGELVGLIIAIYPTSETDSIKSELEADFEATGFFGGVRSGTAWLAGAFVFAIPVFVSSILLQVLRYAYPLPDLLFLAWGLSAVVIPRISFGPDSGRLVNFEFDLERYLFDTVEHATRSIMGVFCLLFLVIGLLLSGLFLLTAVTIADQVSGVFAIAIGAPSVLTDFNIASVIWGWLGTVVLLLASGSHALWVWLRELARLPWYLDRWEDRTSVEEDVLLPDVRGSILVSSQAWLVAVLGIAVQGTPTVRFFGLAWPISLFLVIWSVRGTLQQNNATIPRSAPKLVATLSVQTMVFWLGTNTRMTIQVLRTGDGVSELLVTPLGLIMLIGFAGLLPYAERYQRDRSGIHRYALACLVFIIGFFGAAWSAVTTGNTSTAGLLMAVICSISGLALVTVLRLDV